LEYTEGSGTVISPALTYGSLDLGGASTQIAFYDPNEDIMSNLFKLQIGAAKHWNVYTHSYLMFGANAAYDRLNARLYFNTPSHELEEQRGVYNPCLPRDSKTTFTSKIQVDPLTGMSKWPAESIANASSTVGMYTTLIRNDNATDSVTNITIAATIHPTNDDAIDVNSLDDASSCVKLANVMLNKQTSNEWCNFEHKQDCSFAGVYQPQLPFQSQKFGEFLGFSNFHHVFDFLELNNRSSMTELREGVSKVCNMNLDQITAYNAKKKTKRQAAPDELLQYCFRASYVFAILHHGYGFDMDKYITAKHKIEGHKVTWAIGSVLYEINTLPWNYERNESPPPTRHVVREFIHHHIGGRTNGTLVTYGFIVLVLLSIQIMCIKSMRRQQRRHDQHEYRHIPANDETQPILKSPTDLTFTDTGSGSGVSATTNDLERMATVHEGVGLENGASSASPDLHHRNGYHHIE
jgi:hypothetical protein